MKMKSALLGAVAVIGLAVLGYISGRQVPPAPPLVLAEPLDYNVWRSSLTLVPFLIRVSNVGDAIA